MGCRRVRSCTTCRSWILSNVLAQEELDLDNRQVIINAKMRKQTQIIQSEGNRRSIDQGS